MPVVFIAYGTSYGAAAGYYLLILGCFLLFSLITAGVGITIAHTLTRLFPARRARNALFGIGVFLLLLIYFLIKRLIPQDISTPEGFINSIMSFKTESPMLPSYWITEAVFPILKKSGFSIFYSVILLNNALFFLLLSEITGSRFYRVNMERIQPSGEMVRRGALVGYYPEVNTAMFYKDIKIFFRDAGQWSQVFIIGALIVIYVYNFKTIPVTVLLGFPFIKEIMALVNLVLSGLVLSAVSARFIYASVSLEGQAFWLIRTSPIDINRFIRSKFLYGFIPVTSLMLILVFLTNLAINIRGVLMYLSLGTVLMLCISVSGLGTGFGAIYPKFRHENIASVSMSLGGMAFMLIAFSVVIATLSLEAWIFYVHNLKGEMDMSGKIQIAASLVMIILINAIAFYLPMRIGKKKLQEQTGII
jgi:ABC-2 type transport system permease protein